METHEITSKDIMDALEQHYPAPEWELCWEVANGTGVYKRRALDALAINTYPSQGFATHGIEIKTSKSDLKRELKNGAKSDIVAQYCTYFFLAVPKGIIDETITLPPTWGVLELRGNKLYQTKKPHVNEARELDHGFLAAMLRGRDRYWTIKLRYDREAYRREVIEGYKLTSSNAALRTQQRLDGLEAKLKEIKDTTGISLTEWSPTEEICKNLIAASTLRDIRHKIERAGVCAAELSRYAKEV
jgi:hypothetical protein